MNPVELVPRTVYIVQDSDGVMHDGVNYPQGAVFPFSEPAIIDLLLFYGSVKTQADIELARRLADENALLAQNNADLATQVEQLKAQLSQALAPKGKKSVADEQV